MPVYHPHNITRDILLKNLSEGLCSVTFQKVKDNTIRTILCTLVMDAIPSKFEKTVTKIFDIPENPDIFPIWDVEEGKWKSFKISRMVEFRTGVKKFKEFSGNKNSNKTNEKMKELKEKVQDDFFKRMEEMRNKKSGE